MKSRYLIYGATGYTGQLCVETALRHGHQPIIAGRQPQKVYELAIKTGCEARVFDLDNVSAIAAQLEDVAAVLHCAGPFSKTSAPMLAACSKSGAHYLDITGEIDVFEAIFRQDQSLRAAGVSAIPGVGFDVVPSDCLAALLKKRLPDANKLILAIDARHSSISPGTLKTTLESLALGARIRQDGQIVALGSQVRSLSIPFVTGPATAWCVAWGDIATAYHTTQIPNIEVYMALAKTNASILKMARIAGMTLRLPIARSLVNHYIERRVFGPSAALRLRSTTNIWGYAENQRGQSASLSLTTSEGYTLTAEAAIAAVERVLAGGIPPGALTPSQAFGTDFALGLPGVRLNA